MLVSDDLALLLVAGTALAGAGGLITLGRWLWFRRAVYLFRREREHLYEAVGIGELTHDPTTDQLTWSSKGLELLRLPPSDPPATMSELLSRLNAGNSARVEQSRLAALGTSGRGPEAILEFKDSRSWIGISWEAVGDRAGHRPATIGLLRDVSREKELEEQLAQAAQKDVLTGLPLRSFLQRSLEETLEDVRQSGGRLAALCIDLDGFRSINDRWGHRAGDRLLQEVATRLSDLTKPGDLLARLSGDEFVLIQTALPADAARAANASQQLAADVLRRLSHPYDLAQERQGHVTASVGVALFPTDSSEADALLEHAYTALHRAKVGGGNRWSNYIFDTAQERHHSRALDQDLKQSIARGEFEIAWQPQAALTGPKAGSIVGFEALLRWRHPERGLLSPDIFIPAAENSGDILAIGEWVLNTACREAMRWKYPLRVGVNVSPAQVQQGDIIAVVRNALLTSGLPPERLELEVTEGLVIRDVGRARIALASLRELGVAITLDDFGTGYSSLTTLRAFPFDRMKLDRGFVAAMTEDSVSAAIVGGTLDLAKRLGLPVTAEGVETEEQRDALLSQGCDEIQGWLVGRPMPVEQWNRITG